MLHEQIKALRKAKGMSQEELAVQLHVVRQTVSKWENGLSVPDADVVLRIAEVLGVSVSQLLELPADSQDGLNLAEELAKANQQLAEYARRETLQRQVGRKRGWILFLSFWALLLALLIRQEIVSLLLTGACLLAAAILLYRNLPLLTSEAAEGGNLKVLRLTTLCSIGMFVAGVAFALLIALDVVTFSEYGERMFAMAVVSCVMLFAGIVAPKLPYSRHTGLRLPWTVLDEETWYLAHRILGGISLPVTLLYIACSLTVSSFELVTLGAMILWIGVPGLLSGLFFWRKMRGR